MKISSWNVNGIRSVCGSTFYDWLRGADPDIVCLQEIKADWQGLTPEITQIEGYYAYFNSAAKKGYSGVAVYSKIKPLNVETKLGISRFDEEGRVLKLTFDNFMLFNFYIPNGGRFKENMNYKLEAYDQLCDIVKPYAKKETILVGDFNVAHEEIDLYFPKQNQNNTMFTPEERKQIDRLLSMGYIDSFRKLYPDKKAYTWWPYRLDLRERDVGWRIDYTFVSKSLEDKVKDAFMERETKGSDHGPINLILDKKVKLGPPPTYKRETPTTLF